MGNDHSNVKGLEIDQKAVEVTDFWTLYSGELTNADRYTLISIFKDVGIVNGQLWATQSPLDRFTKNLMIHRHPSILKFITSWERGSNKFLATERCKPLFPDISGQSDVQICLGLRSILCALIFLTEQANARHLNVCTSSIYVNQDGTWKLAGFEHLWKAKDVTIALLERCQSYRYKKAIDPNELKASSTNGIEQYSFGTLCQDVLKSSNKTLPHLNEFKTYCSAHLKHPNISMRPKLSAILLHPFFNHEFVVIHSFLTELPLKSHEEKQQFFTNLIERLRQFDEEIVAKQLIGFLLSRMVLLDQTAQLCVTPFVLRPRTDDNFGPLFGPTNFTKFIVPRLMNIFYVRDAQIRLILLEYFNSYICFISTNDLQEQLLPQLLVGIKDTNDILVAATLRCLADLVPILGSAVVIGRNRGRIFADGRPTTNGLTIDSIQSTSSASANWPEHRSITPVMNIASNSSGHGAGAGHLTGISGSPILDHVDISESYASPQNSIQIMPERYQPDGGEDVTSSGVLEFEDDGWSDWEAENVIDHTTSTLPEELKQSTIGNDIDDDVTSQPPVIVPSINEQSFIKDIKELDIKIKRKKSADAEFDFFKDMEPVIQKTNVLLINSTASSSSTTNATKVSSSTLIDNEIIDEEKLMSNDEVGKVKEDEEVLINTSQQQQQQHQPITIDKSRFEIKTIDGDADEMGWDDETNEWDEND